MEEPTLGTVLARMDSDDYQTAVVSGLGVTTVEAVVTFGDKSQLLTVINRRLIGPGRTWQVITPART